MNETMSRRRAVQKHDLARTPLRPLMGHGAWRVPQPRKRTRQRLPFLVGAILVLCVGCRYDPYHYEYLRNAPSRNEICGVWVVDTERTNWPDAAPHLRDESTDAERGHLEIKPDGRFLLVDLVDFSKFQFGPVTVLKSASGAWWIGTHPVYDWSYLWLKFEQVDGVPMEDKDAAAYFRREGDEYLLHVIIGDPDEGDFLVFRRTNEIAELPGNPDVQ